MLSHGGYPKTIQCSLCSERKHSSIWKINVDGFIMIQEVLMASTNTVLMDTMGTQGRILAQVGMKESFLEEMRTQPNLKVHIA